MEYIQVTKENLEKEHICCAISNNNDIQVSSKKNWLKDRFDDGLVFIKSENRYALPHIHKYTWKLVNGIWRYIKEVFSYKL